ncbi:MAG: cobalamin-dependent protein [Propionibacteriaceae bacterium]|jgi:5-methyltetrahydrofolate--homocysteine methyltransferase|nr:cobalamin-dependent protein [Propionibacteriaceae bacterium]
MSTIDELSTAVQKGKVKDVLALLETGLAEGSSAQQLLDEGLLKGMSLLGVRFKNNEVFVPEVLVAARALNKGSEFLKPYLIASGVEPKGRAVIGTVKGDLHDIGKNLVKMMLEGTGFEVTDLGVDVPDEQFLSALDEYQPDILLLSALLTTTMGQLKSVIDTIDAAGGRGKAKILVGGAPVTADFATQIGADGYAPDAASAAELAFSMLELAA